MPLESATYINGLEPSNPAGTDLLAEADNHLRLIKSVLKNTFPNLNGPVSASDEQLSNVPTLVPIGLITIWYGDSGSVPSGWAICNGQTVARSDGAGNITTPNLVDRCVVGAGTIAAQGVAAGAGTTSVNTGDAGSHGHAISGGEHSHGGSVGGTTLTPDQMPAHRHGNGVADDNTNGIMWRGTQPTPGIGTGIQNAGSGPIEGITETVGGGQPHGHSLSIASSSHSHSIETVGNHAHSVTISTIQPVYGLHYIMKV